MGIETIVKKAITVYVEKMHASCNASYEMRRKTVAHG